MTARGHITTGAVFPNTYAYNAGAGDGRKSISFDPKKLQPVTPNLTTQEGLTPIAYNAAVERRSQAATPRSSRIGKSAFFSKLQGSLTIFCTHFIKHVWTVGLDFS